MRVTLTGGIPLKSLRITSGDEPVFDQWQDTWPLDDLLHDIYSQNYDSEFDVLAHGLQFLQQSNVAKALIDDAIAQGWEAGLCELGGTDFHIDVPLKKIILNNNNLPPNILMRSPYFKNIFLMAMVRALRDVWHEKRQGGFDEKFGAEGILMLERVRAADCDVITVLAGWELRAVGEGEFWRHLLASDEGDLAISFGCALEKNMSYPVHKALAAAFDQWYRVPERAMRCDHDALEYIDGVLRTSGTLGNRMAASIDIEALSCLPDKTAYLQGCGNNIIRAPFYAGLHDEVNQSHFMQIVHDMSVTYVQGVPFRDSGLAAKIFPGGLMTEDTQSETSSS
jgi:hypothetical protein